ncbi:hypothetical protein GE09DRAFT_503509 [Coniochaeta sp. 2T2.1]|nr:hypothetical protein GE09DRAFT_503509 [Coniochaeta sp. 2T2.1]
MGGFYMAYLENLCRRRNWEAPGYQQYHSHEGWTSVVYVNGREYQTDLPYESDVLAMENAAMRAFMICRNFSVNSGMLARNGVVQGLPVDDSSRKPRKGASRHGKQVVTAAGHGYRHQSQRSGHHSSSSSTASFE